MKNNITYLIDADSLMFVKQENLEQAIFIIENKINRITEHKNNVKLCFSKKSFRKDIYSAYKANRANNTLPVYYDDIKQYLKNNYNFIEEEGLEADDILVKTYLDSPEQFKMCSIDKDVIKTVAGSHYDLYNQKWITTTKEEANYYLAKQLLIGDRIDNIPNLYKGFGVKTCENIFQLNKEQHPFTIAINLLKKYRLNIEVQYKLVAVGRMHLFEEFINTYDKKIKVTTAVKNKKFISNKTAQAKTEYVLTFGKYKNKYLIDVKKSDVNYYNWIKENIKNNEQLNKAIHNLENTGQSSKPNKAMKSLYKKMNSNIGGDVYLSDGVWLSSDGSMYCEK